MLPHRITAHFDAMRVVDQLVENAVGQRGIADLLVPSRDQLQRKDGGAHLAAILAYLPKVAAPQHTVNRARAALRQIFKSKTAGVFRW